MYIQSILVIFCLLICSYSQVAAKKKQLPEDDPKNFKYQNATKLVKLGGRHWVKRRTYNVTKFEKVTCEYAEILKRARKDKYTLKLGAKLESNWTSGNQTLLLKKTGDHLAPNVLNFTRLSDDGPLGHPLLYSNYKDCHIVRIMKKNSTEYRCDLLLTNGAAKQAPPPDCETRFKKYCPGTPVEVYSNDCDNTGPKTA
uniref:Putative salivary lipocalin n=1 Tax=Ixodes ricinus TaxID=34613 RepID=A0A0K8R926_IXORI